MSIQGHRRKNPNRGKCHSELLRRDVERIARSFEGPAAPAPWTIVVPGWRPSSVNELFRGRRRDRIGRAKRDRIVIANAAADAVCRGVPLAGECERRRVTMTVRLGPGDRVLDVDSLWKSCLDGLVGVRLLAGDTPYLAEIAPVLWERGSELRTTIVLEPLPRWRMPGAID